MTVDRDKIQVGDIVTVSSTFRVMNIERWKDGVFNNAPSLFSLQHGLNSDIKIVVYPSECVTHQTCNDDIAKNLRKSLDIHPNLD